MQHKLLEMRGFTTYAWRDGSDATTCGRGCLPPDPNIYWRLDVSSDHGGKIRDRTVLRMADLDVSLGNRNCKGGVRSSFLGRVPFSHQQQGKKNPPFAKGVQRYIHTTLLQKKHPTQASSHLSMLSNIIIQASPHVNISSVVPYH